jgi:hypothetical protein
MVASRLGFKTGDSPTLHSLVEVEWNVRERLVVFVSVYHFLVAACFSQEGLKGERLGREMTVCCGE